MYDALGVITNKPQSDLLGELTHFRSINTVPFGGKYRLIDFALSNMVNSGLNKIGVIGSHKYKVLVDHLGTGQEWSLSRKSRGLCILDGGMNFYVDERPKINLMDFLKNIQFFKDSAKKNVVISDSDIISNLNFENALEDHNNKNADVTLIYKKCDENYEYNMYDTLLSINKETKRVINMSNREDSDCKEVFLDMLIIKKDLLLTLLNDCDSLGINWDLIDVIKNNLFQLHVNAYEYNGYFCKINSVKKYFKCSMDLLQCKVRDQLFFKEDRIYTNEKDNHPTRYMDSSYTHNILVASGCTINGEIENSVIFRQVKLDKDVKIKNCVIMEKCKIGKGAILENVILDRDVKINDGVVLKGKSDAPIVIGNNCCLG